MKSYDAAAGDNAFGLSLLGQVEKGKNAVVSPYNIRSALALVYEGATRETAKEIAAVAGFAEDRPAQRAAFRSLIDTINNAKGYTLRSANGLWLAKNYPVKNDFKTAAADEYQAKIKNVDFHGNADGERQAINQWVSDNTEAKIPKLFPGNSLNENTIFVIASALYFKGQWDAKFSTDYTQKQDFTLSTGEKVKVEMMRKGHLEGKTPKFQYAEFDGAQVVALPYQGKEVAKVVFLPPKGETVDNLVAELQRQKRSVLDLASSMRSEEFARLELPKHEVRGNYGLVPLLKAMGMERMFSAEDAQFDSISTAEHLYVGSGFHKTFFKTDEEGSEGAAATGFGGFRSTSVQRPREPKEFVADRPFLEAILHKPTGSVLFLNRIENPLG